MIACTHTFINIQVIRKLYFVQVFGFVLHYFSSVYNSILLFSAFEFDNDVFFFLETVAYFKIIGETLFPVKDSALQTSSSNSLFDTSNRTGEITVVYLDNHVFQCKILYKMAMAERRLHYMVNIGESMLLNTDDVNLERTR